MKNLMSAKEVIAYVEDPKIAKKLAEDILDLLKAKPETPATKKPEPKKAEKKEEDKDSE